jgi:hypothetical protein
MARHANARANPGAALDSGEVSSRPDITPACKAQARLAFASRIEARRDVVLAELAGDVAAQRTLCQLAERPEPTFDRIAAAAERGP